MTMSQLSHKQLSTGRSTAVAPQELLMGGMGQQLQKLPKESGIFQSLSNITFCQEEEDKA